MIGRSRTLVPALIVAAILGLAACSDAGTPSSAGTAAVDSSPHGGSATDGVRVVATTTILGDIAGQVAECGGGSVQILMPAGADPHDFAPSSQQVADMVTADLVVANGLGLEAGLTDALDNALADGAVILEVAPMVDPLTFPGPGEDPGQPNPDPHVWFDMARMASAAELIGTSLADRTGDATFTACGTKVADAISDADVQVRSTLESLPQSERVLVTDHSAFNYLASEYGYRIVGTVIPANTTLAEPSSAELAALAKTIRDEHVHAIFTNVGAGTALAEAVAAEAGTDVAVVPLYVESLGEPGSGADTYVGMMQSNATSIVNALKG